MNFNPLSTIEVSTTNSASDKKRSKKICSKFGNRIMHNLSLKAKFCFKDISIFQQTKYKSFKTCLRILKWKSFKKC